MPPTGDLRIAPRDQRLAQAAAALRVVHEHDGYPVVWPVDPAAWLTPACTLAAWVALAGHAVVGHALLVAGERVVFADRLAAAAAVPLAGLAGVSRLFVVPSARRSRAATALLDHVGADAAECGLRLALDTVDDGGAAIRLYERLGWERVAEGLADWTWPDGRRPLLAAFLAPQ